MRTFYVVMTDKNTFLSRIAGKPFFDSNIDVALQYETETEALKDLTMVRAYKHNAVLKKAKEEITLL